MDVHRHSSLVGAQAGAGGGEARASSRGTRRRQAWAQRGERGCAGNAVLAGARAAAAAAPVPPAAGLLLLLLQQQLLLLLLLPLGVVQPRGAAPAGRSHSAGCSCTWCGCPRCFLTPQSGPCSSTPQTCQRCQLCPWFGTRIGGLSAAGGAKVKGLPTQHQAAMQGYLRSLGMKQAVM
jgi:hypothetical protein